MATDLLDGLQRVTQENLARAAIEEHASALASLVPGLLKSIKEGTLTLEEVDSFLQRIPQVPPDLQQYLISEKAWLLLRQGQGEEALHQYDQALSINPDSAVIWARKGAALLELSRVDEAFQHFQQAYSLRDNFGSQKQGYLKDLFQGWSTGAVSKGLTAIREENVQKLRTGVQEYLEVQERARNEGIEGTEVKLVIGEDGESVPQQLRDTIEEWELAVRLLSIKDPFEGWRALTKEMTKVWPEGLSAVDAVREQRE